MAKKITSDDIDLLDELGVEAKRSRTDGLSAREQRIMTGFEEIDRFVTKHGRLPEHGEKRDIFERLYATRLDAIRRSKECRDILKTSSLPKRLIEDFATTSSDSKSESTDAELLASLGVEVAPAEDITRLVHVRPHEEIKAAEEVAQRNPCRDFDRFRPIFGQTKHDLETGNRQTLKYQNNAEVRTGGLFILDGQMVIVAEMGDEFVSDYGRPDRRLRVVYDNGTESDLLLRSLQRALNKDKASRRITNPDPGPLFSGKQEANDLPSGSVYVLRSKSEHPFVAQNRSVLHKIGVTAGDVKARIANAKKDPTYLLADVEILATFKLANIDRKKLEALLHKFFGKARLDLELKDRFDFDVAPKEWFLV
ncbi:MAG: GIY-YIG nuclease family protein, partial [Paracoccus sp. (in: a-proteobacteria)]